MIIGLTAFYDYDLGLETEKLYSLSRLVEKLRHIALHFGKGLVGDNAFVHRHDDNVKSSLEMPSSTVPIEPGLVGNRRRIVLGGEYTVPFVVKAKAKEMSIDLSNEKLDRALSLVREGLQGRKTLLTDEEFLPVIQKLEE